MVLTWYGKPRLTRPALPSKTGWTSIELIKGCAIQSSMAYDRFTDSIIRYAKLIVVLWVVNSSWLRTPRYKPSRPWATRWITWVLKTPNQWRGADDRPVLPVVRGERGHFIINLPHFVLLGRAEYSDARKYMIQLVMTAVSEYFQDENGQRKISAFIEDRYGRTRTTNDSPEIIIIAVFYSSE